MSDFGLDTRGEVAIVKSRRFPHSSSLANQGSDDKLDPALPKAASEPKG